MLTAQETRELFEVLRALKREGVVDRLHLPQAHEVLEVADRVTVLRRGKRVETVATAGADEPSLARLMVGRDVLFCASRRTPRKPGEPLLEVADLARARRPRPARRRGVDAAGARRRDRRASRASTATARASSSRRSPACGTPTGGQVARRRPRHHRRRRRGARAAGVGAHRRGPPPARPRARLHARGEPRAARVPDASSLSGCCRRAGCASARRAAARASSTSAAATPSTPPRSLSGGNQQKVVIAREISGNPRRSSPRSRRAAWTSARSSSCTAACSPSATRAGRPARLARARGGPLAGRPHPRDLRRPDRRRAPARRVRRGARAAHDRRRRAAAAAVERRRPAARAGEPPPGAARSRSRLRGYLRGGGVLVPLLTALVAFFLGGLVVLVTGRNPLVDLQGDLRRARA